MTKSVVGTPSTWTAGPAESSTVTWPSGIQSGDIAILVATWWEANSDRTFNTPLNFTNEFASTAYAGTGTAESRIAVYSKACTGSETGTLAVSYNGPGTYGIVSLCVYRGTGALTYAATTETTNSGNGTTATPATISGSNGQAHFIIVACDDESTIGTPSGMSVGVSATTGITPGHKQFYTELSSGGNTATPTSTLGSTKDWYTITFLLDDAGFGASGGVPRAKFFYDMLRRA